MGSTTSLPTIGRGNPHSDYTAAKRSASSTGADKQQKKQQQQQGQQASTNGSTDLARSKSCSNANYGKQHKQQQQQQQLEAEATNGGQFHKVSNGNYAPEPEQQAAATSASQLQRQAQPPPPQQQQQQQQRPPTNGGLVGLSNLGNTCYMNSILQCLSHTEPLLRHFVLERRQPVERIGGDSSSGLARAYANLMLRMWTAGGSDCTSPSELKQCVAQYAPRFRGYSQQDAQEFLRYLLEGLHEDLNLVTVRPKLAPIDYERLDLVPDDDKADELWQRYLQQENSAVVDAFVGQLKSTLECCHCSHKSVTFDPFWDLALPIPGKSRTSLEACLKLFTAQETLDGNERPTCDRCNCRRKCVKRFHLYRLPGVLVIHLMRFSGERFKTKLNTLVEYPMELDVSEFLDKKCRLRQTPQYRLHAVSEHSGTPYGGHYTAVVRHAGSGRWLRYNDTRVDEASVRSVVSTEGYVLFYSRADAFVDADVDDGSGDENKVGASL